MPTTVSTNGRNYVEYRLAKRPGVSPENLLGEYKGDLNAAEWVFPVDSSNGNVVVEDTAEHWLLRLDSDQNPQGFLRARTAIW